MTHLYCVRCSIRFAAPATLSACPACGRPLERTEDAESLLGLKCFRATAAGPTGPDAVVVSFPPFHLKHTHDG